MTDIREQIACVRELGRIPNVVDDSVRIRRCDEIADDMEKMLAVVEVASPMIKEIQRQLETNTGWIQFEFFTPEIDMYNFIKTQKALAALDQE